MGAPKQKWTAEEEAALKAGVVKHGAGKWRTILTDPEFSAILRMRSNVDLKDKWRNINVTAIWGSRQKAKLALKRSLPAPKIDNNHMALSMVVRHDEVLDTKPLAVSGGPLQSPNVKEQISRLVDNHILEAIVNMKEQKGSDKAAIISYIEEKYRSPPNLSKLLSTKLKHMVASGKIIKMIKLMFSMVYLLINNDWKDAKQYNLADMMKLCQSLANEPTRMHIAIRKKKLDYSSRSHI
uniref:MYB transcription factor n=1 Tax=Cajanus cajan TaxID=3821 RepID=A0A151RXU7_CAJCA|nr:Histone H1 [Cajanus cajan]